MRARRHGRATFSVLLFQDLAVVVLLMLIPLLAPDPSGNSGGMAKIATVSLRHGQREPGDARLRLLLCAGPACCSGWQGKMCCCWRGCCQPV